MLFQNFDVILQENILLFFSKEIQYDLGAKHGLCTVMILQNFPILRKNFRTW